MRKQTQGIADCLFRFKFDNFHERIAKINTDAFKFSSTTPSFVKTPVRSVFKSNDKRPWSVPAVFNKISMTNRISSLCSDNAYFGYANFLKECNKRKKSKKLQKKFALLGNIECYF